MDKFILRTYKPAERKGQTNIVKLDDKAMRTLEELQRATGLPLKQIASKAIVFAAEHVEIEEE